MEGNLVVDGILASCYPSANHDFAHLAMTPIKWFPMITKWIFGEDTGFQVYHSISDHIGEWILPNRQMWEY